MYLRPTTLDEACDALAAAPAAILSGGTDFYPTLGERAAPERILDLSRIQGLAGIVEQADAWRFGAGTTWSEIAKASLPDAFRALQEAAREVGSVQIQNVGTLGGNLCNASPAADGVPPLLALDASVELASRDGVRRVALAEFLRGNRRTVRRPDEILSAILVSRPAEGARSTFLKLGSRRYLVISIVMIAVVLVPDGEGRVAEASVAVGSCSAVACRLPALEAALLGAALRPGLGDLARPEHLEPIAPIDDIRATAAYRGEAAFELVRRALDACAAA